MRGKRWNSRNFPSINWTVKARKQAFSWINPNPLSQKIQEHSCEHRKTRYFPKVHRTVNIGKQAFSWIHACLLSGKMKEKHKKTPENEGTHDNFRKFAERRTSENTRFLEFSWIRRLGKQKKTEENFCERQNTLCFPYVNRAVNWGKQCVLRNLPAFDALENKGKCGFSIVDSGWTWSFTPGKHSWTQANNTFAKC